MSCLLGERALVDVVVVVVVVVAVDPIAILWLVVFGGAWFVAQQKAGSLLVSLLSLAHWHTASITVVCLCVNELVFVCCLSLARLQLACFSEQASEQTNQPRNEREKCRIGERESELCWREAFARERTFSGQLSLCSAPSWQRERTFLR